MYKTELSDGGQVRRIDGVLQSIEVSPPDPDQDNSKMMQLILHAKNPDDGDESRSLTYLSIEEAMNLSRSLTEAIKETVNNYVTAKR